MCVAMVSFAQSCYNDNRSDGLKFMNAKQYDKAIRCFNAAKGCPDKPANNDLNQLIAKCNNLKKQGTSGNNASPASGSGGANSTTPPPPAPVPLSVDGGNKASRSISVSAEGLSKAFKVKSPAKYTVTSDKEWCTITEQTATGFKGNISANVKPQPRTATITVTCGKETITITMKQDAKIPDWAPNGTVRKVSSPAAEMPAMLSHMRSKSSCRLAGLTSNRRGVTVNGDCDIFYTSAIPEMFKTILNNIQKSKSHIDAIAMTGSDYYCVVWDGRKWDGKVPVAMKEKLNGYINNNEEILSMSISDDGNFVILTNKHVYASRKSDRDFIMSAEDKYGQARSISITTYGICVRCEYNIVYMNVPDNLATVLRSSHIKPEKIVYTDAGTYILIDNDGKCEFNIR